MKKLLMGAIALSCFAIAICLIEISCSKSKAQQNRPLDNPQLSKIVFLRYPNPNTRRTEIWTANYDGTGATQIPITMPNGMAIGGPNGIANVKLSPDGQKIFFVACTPYGTYPTVWSAIYSSNIDGSNITEVVPGDSTSHVLIGGAY